MFQSHTLELSCSRHSHRPRYSLSSVANEFCFKFWVSTSGPVHFNNYLCKVKEDLTLLFAVKVVLNLPFSFYLSCKLYHWDLYPVHFFYFKL